MTIIASMLPVPPRLSAKAVWSGTPWFYTAWGAGLGLAIVPWCLKRAIKDGDALPVLAWLGGLLSCTFEPLYAHTAHVWWPSDMPGPAFTAYDLHIPLLIPPTYALVVGMLGYYAFRRFESGLAPGQILILWSAFVAANLILEYPGVQLGAFVYYGRQPWEIAKASWITSWLNGTAYFLVGYTLYLTKPILTGRRVVLITLIPVTVLVAVVMAAGWPHFLALNAHLPTILAWILSAGSLVLCGLIAYVASLHASPGRTHREEPIAIRRLTA